MATSKEIQEFLETVKEKSVHDNYVSVRKEGSRWENSQEYYFWEFGIVNDKGQIESYYIKEDLLSEKFSIHEDDGSDIIQEYEELLESIEEAETEEEIEELKEELSRYVSDLTEEEKEFIVLNLSSPYDDEDDEDDEEAFLLN